MSQVDLPYQQVEEILESIVLNKKLFQAQSKIGPIFVFFSHPSSLEILQSRYIRAKALLEASAAGLPTMEEMAKSIEVNNLSGTSDVEAIHQLEQKIVAQKRVLQITRIEGRRKPIEDLIKKFEADIEKIKHRNDTLFYMTSDKKAEEESFLYLAWAGTYDTFGEKHWPNFLAFESETDLLFRASVLQGFSTFNVGTPLSIIRFLARHNLWRIRYSSALKIGGSLFSRELNDLTTDQLSLLYWSNYYQSIYEMMPDDQPPEEVIKDDQALDSFMEDYFKRRDKERKEGRVSKSSTGKRGKLSAWEKGEELIITPAHPEYMSIPYSEERVQPQEGTAEVEVISRTSRRARNRAQARSRR